MTAAIIQTVNDAPRIHEDAGTGNYFSVLWRRHRHLNHIDAKQGRIRIRIRLPARTSGQLFVLAHKGSAGHIDVDVVLVIRIDDQRMRVRAAASLHRGHLLRTLDVTDIENANAPKAIFLRCWWLILILSSSGWRSRRKSLRTAIYATIRQLARH